MPAAVLEREFQEGRDCVCPPCRYSSRAPRESRYPVLQTYLVDGGLEGGREGRHEVNSEVWKIRLSLDKWRPWKKEMEKGEYSRQEGSMYKCRRMSVVVITVDPDIRSTPVICPGHS